MVATKPQSVPKLKEVHRTAGIREAVVGLMNLAVLCWIDLTKVDHNSKTNYRIFDPRHSAVLKSRFKARCVLTPILGYFKGKLESVNGRHTIDTLLAEGYRWYQAEVHFDIDDATAATMFYEVADNTKRMDQWSSYNAALAGRYQRALDIEALMKEFAFHCPAHEGFGMRNSDIRSISPLYEAYSSSLDTLRKIFMVLAAWRDQTDNCELPKMAGKCEFLRGLLDFIVKEDTTNMRTVIARIMVKTPDEYTDKATGYGTRQVDRALRGHFARAFREVYASQQAKKAA